MELEIKKVIKRIYNFDFSNTVLVDGSEIITSNNVSEFVNQFKLYNLDEGIIVTPSGYQKGLVYKSTNGGEVYNNPAWFPDIVSFAFNIFGLKKNAFYKLTVKARGTPSSVMDITNDRTITVSNSNKELLLEADLKNVKENTEYSTIFKATSNEVGLFFSLGKIYLNNIIIDEVELFSEEPEQEEVILNEIKSGKIQTVALGVFTTQAKQKSHGRYTEMTRLTGKGIVLYFDSETNQYIIERDNKEETLTESFTNANYIVDINLNKVVNKGFFSQYNISEVSADISPNTLKQGYIKFEFVDDSGKAVNYTENEGRLAILINKIY